MRQFLKFVLKKYHPPNKITTFDYFREEMAISKIWNKWINKKKVRFQLRKVCKIVIFDNTIVRKIIISFQAGYFFM